MDQPNVVTQQREPWNKGKLVGQKAPFKLKEIWAIRIRLQLANCARDLALFDLAIDSKLRACDLVNNEHGHRAEQEGCKRSLQQVVISYLLKRTVCVHEQVELKLVGRCLLLSSVRARKRLADGFSTWRDHIENGLVKMRERGELADSADPHELALALLSAVEGGLLLAKTAQSSRPLEIALDMAIDHVARHVTARPGTPKSRRR